MTKIAPSVLTADFCELGTAIKTLKEAGADLLHLDIMDGIFVPNISFGFAVVESIRKHTDMILDAHLMIQHPDRYIQRFADAGADIIGIHFESDCDVEATLNQIKATGKKACLTIKPATKAEEVFPFLDLLDMVLVMSVEPGFGGQSFMHQSLDKVRLIKAEIQNRNLCVDIQIDGGIDLNTAPLAVEAGANVLVTGNVLFSAPDMTVRMQEIRDCLK